MIVHALVEGPSEKAFLEPWAKRFLKDHQLKAYPHQGKGHISKKGDPKQRGLLDQLPAKLRAFGKSLDPNQERVLVVIDADGDDIEKVTETLESIVNTIEPRPIVMFRFAVEELEAFYLADHKALMAAFPNHNRQRVRQYVPDSIVGTWELFGKVIGDGGGNKVDWAKRMAKVLTTRAEESRSPSFRVLCTGLRELVTSNAVAPAPRKKPRKAKTAVFKDASGRRLWKR
jgi:hypothetical protein